MSLAGAATIERLTGAPVGFAGPVGLSNVRLVADHAAARMVNAVAGANKTDAHLTNVNPGRDFPVAQTADLRLVTPEDPCPKCGGRIEFVQAIEVGHVFKLGTKYTETLGATVQDQTGKAVPMVMGCYGIGINRILAAAVEQHHDAHGIIWPPALAPFQVIVSVMEADKPEAVQTGAQMTQKLEAAHLSVLLDDRRQSPGSKLKDADLVGIPVQVVIGKAWQSDRQVEVTLRATKEKTRLNPEGLVETVHKLLDRAVSS